MRKTGKYEYCWKLYGRPLRGRRGRSGTARSQVHFADSVASGATTSERMTRGFICKRKSDVLEE